MEREGTMGKVSILIISIIVAVSIHAAQEQHAHEKVKPASKKKLNILVLWGDDIGWFNLSAYNRGIMGYSTPHIDRIAREGALCTDFYSQQSCTAGRAAFITGQSPIRTGLTKVGLPGSKLGIRKEDPTIAELLKPYGYRCGQFGKNHLGDSNEMLPTAHGFDEFFGNLYHLNAEEEPEHPDYPKAPAFRKKYGPRGVIHSIAHQKIKDTGPLTKKRMETIDDEITQAALCFIEQTVKQDKPFFVWYNSTRMHIWTRLKASSKGKSGYGIYADGMLEHDARIGQLLKKLDDLGVAENTLVIYSTDNGAEVFSWPDGGMTPFRGEKGSNWEGGFRVPCVIRWPHVIKPGTVYNDILSHEDWLPTFLAAVGDPHITKKLLEGTVVGKKRYKVHLDGYNLLPFFEGKVKESPRKEFLYWNDDGALTALRYKQWKFVFAEQRAPGIKGWEEPFITLRVPKLFNLRTDPFERADRDSINYEKWRIEHIFLMIPAQEYIAQWLKTFKAFPPRQKAASFTITNIMESLKREAQD